VLRTIWIRNPWPEVAITQTEENADRTISAIGRGRVQVAVTIDTTDHDGLRAAKNCAQRQVAHTSKGAIAGASVGPSTFGPHPATLPSPFSTRLKFWSASMAMTFAGAKAIH